MKGTLDFTNESYNDLINDFEELEYLFSDSHKKLHAFYKLLKSHSRNFHIETQKELLKNTYEAIKKYKEILLKVTQYKNELKNSDRSEKRLFSFLKEKRILYDTLRTLQLTSSALICSTDFQSPSFSHSLYSQAGRQTEKITGNINDYKRDQHLDGNTYEQRFLKEYINSFFKLPIHVYATNSGMAACTTAIYFVLMHANTKGPILMGTSTYFENKELIQKIWKEQVVEVNEHNTDAICKKIKTLKPTTIFFDSFCNSYDIAIPNLSIILPFLTKTVKKDTFIVIDNTSMATFFQPLSYIQGKNRHIRIIVTESLNKYHQFGMDRVTGGIIYAWGKDTGNLFSVREHAGTNISDISAITLPTPHKKLLERRMKRLERNNTFLTHALSEYLVNKPHKKISHIISPALSSHPAHKWSSFSGSYFSIAFTKRYEKTSVYKKFIKLILEKAKKENIQIASATSFGLNTSRIYLTSLRSDFGKPFIRFSVGIETKIELEKIKNVLVHAIQKI